jgi:threonine/homoserine/homoserine lactone efflux protein
MAGITRSLIFVAATTVLALSVFPVMAQVRPIIAPDCGFLGISCTGNETFSGNIGPYLQELINIALTLISITAAAFLVYAGFLYITSTGDEDNSSRAKRQIFYALLGIFVAGASMLIVNVVAEQRTGDLVRSITSVVNAVLTILGVAAAIYVIVGGVLYITSTGDQDKSSRAKMQIIYAVSGLIIVILSGVAVNLIIQAV